MKRRQTDTDAVIWVNREHIRMAKSIAGFRGMSLKEYFAQKVEHDIKNLPKEMTLEQEFPKKKNGGYFDSPFK